jgi:hypothetical protein
VGNVDVDIVWATDSLTGAVMVMVIFIVVVVVCLLSAWIGGGI